jgi:hypothetical protein
MHSIFIFWPYAGTIERNHQHVNEDASLHCISNDKTDMNKITLSFQAINIIHKN